MTQQTEAQRLANALDADRTWLFERGLQQQSMAEAAAELRRLETVNKQLLEALKMCIKGTRNIGLGVTTLERLDADPESFLNVARAIAAAKEQA